MQEQIMSIHHRTKAMARGGAAAGQSPASRGQTLVEFSLVVIMVVLVMAGIIDFARLFFSYATIANAVRDGARYGVIHPLNVDSADQADPHNITYRTLSAIGDLGGLETPFIEITFPDGCDYVGCRVSVRVTATFMPATPVVPRLPIVGQAVMYIE
jgi:hypothetical protein